MKASDHHAPGTDYLERYSSDLQARLLSLASERQFLSAQLLETADLDELWSDLLRPYLADAVPDFETYPLVSLGWSTFVGIAMAHYWDSDWEKFAPLGSQLYTELREARGWDELDEYVLEHFLGLAKETAEAERYTSFIRFASEQAFTQLLHEEAEPASPLAFQLYGRTLFALYKLGVALGLSALGYRLEPVTVH